MTEWSIARKINHFVIQREPRLRGDRGNPFPAEGNQIEMDVHAK